MSIANIFFNGGMFGSTLEYMLRQFTVEYYNPIKGSVLAPDGSAHKFHKEAHISQTSLENIIKKVVSADYSISTITPTHNESLTDIVDILQHTIKDHHNILVYADSIQDAELNLLFQYYKIANGSYNLGLDLLFESAKPNDLANWNSSYTRWQDLSRWELREWFSLYYEGMLESNLGSTVPADVNIIAVTNLQLLTNLKNTFIRICNYHGLTINNPQQLESFAVTWTEAQHYIVLKYQIINLILAQIVSYNEKKSTFWWTDLDIVQEAILQKRLRDLGYEIRCDGLDKFPKDIKSLYNLLERC